MKVIGALPSLETGDSTLKRNDLLPGKREGAIDSRQMSAAPMICNCKCHMLVKTAASSAHTPLVANGRVCSLTASLGGNYEKCHQLSSPGAGCLSGASRGRKLSREGDLYSSPATAQRLQRWTMPSATIWHDSSVGVQSLLLSSTLAEEPGTEPASLLLSRRDRGGRRGILLNG